MGLVLLALLAVRPAGLRDVHLFKPREKALVNLKLTGEILKIKPFHNSLFSLASYATLKSRFVASPPG